MLLVASPATRAMVHRIGALGGHSPARFAVFRIPAAPRLFRVLSRASSVEAVECEVSTLASSLVSLLMNGWLSVYEVWYGLACYNNGMCEGDRTSEIL